MADDIAKLGLKVDSKDILKAIQRLDKLEKEAKKTEKQAKKTGKAFSGLGAVLGTVGLVGTLGKVISATSQQEMAVAQLDAALRSTNESAGFTSKELQNLAASLQKTSTFGDEAIISMQSVLLTFTKLQGEILPRTTQAVVDLATRMNMDLQSSAVMLGKALNDPIANLGALSRSGIQFTKDQKELIKAFAESGDMASAQKIILAELETQFGGSARAARDTFGGALKGLSNAFGDLLEADGGMEEAKTAINELTAILQDPATQKAFDTMTTAIIKLVGAMAEGVTWLTEFGDKLGKGLYDLLHGTPEIVDDIAAGTDKVKKDVLTITDALQIKGGTPTPTEAPVKTPEFKDESALETLRQSYMSEVELLEERLLNEQILIDQAREAKVLSEMEHQELMTEINAKYADERAKISEEEAERRKTAVQGMMNNLVSLMDSGNKEMFRIGKVAALAQAVLNLHEAVSGAYKVGAEIGGPPVGAAFAAAAGLAQASRIAAISSTSFGGGGGGAPTQGGVTGGQPVTGTLPPPAQEVQQQQGTQSRELRVTVESDGPHSEGMRKFAESLAETIEDMGGVGRLVIS